LRLIWLARRVALVDALVERQDARRSQLDYAVLGLVITEPGHGYAIANRLEEAWPGLTTWAVYRSLKRLARDRLVRSTQEGQQVSYEATSLGVRTRAAWLLRTLRGPDWETMLNRVMAAGADEIAGVLDGYERACVADLAALGQRSPEGLVEELLLSEVELRVRAQLEWVARARVQLDAAT
jgi:DNA-binding PadR family transcriptional regulator